MDQKEGNIEERYVGWLFVSLHFLHNQYLLIETPWLIVQDPLFIKTIEEKNGKKEILTLRALSDNQMVTPPIYYLFYNAFSTLYW